jgi:CheY-like chemotaxis protein
MLGERMPLRVLVAEDIQVNQKLALRFLEGIGYRADVVQNGTEVIQAIEQKPYDILFLDVQMPEMDGLAATREIHRRWHVASSDHCDDSQHDARRPRAVSPPAWTTTSRSPCGVTTSRRPSAARS